jgi:hypothetical protein
MTATSPHPAGGTTTAPTPGTRAVIRLIEAGSSTTCVVCREMVKFSAKQKRLQVICNVYVEGRWNRVEHFHHECYVAAGHPHGEATAPAPRPSATTAA